MIGLLRKPQHPRDLKAETLRLAPITREMLVAEMGRDLEHRELARMLDARITEEWPPEHWEPHVYDFILKQWSEHPETAGWNRYVLLPEGKHWVLIGTLGAFPRPEGDVEIGYSILPAYQRRGYGTAAAKAFVRWLLRQRDIRSVSAQTYARLPESIKVMERCGMTFVGNGDDPETLRYRKTR